MFLLGLFTQNAGNKEEIAIVFAFCVNRAKLIKRSESLFRLAQRMLG